MYFLSASIIKYNIYNMYNILCFISTISFILKHPSAIDTIFMPIFQLKNTRKRTQLVSGGANNA